MTQHKNKLVRLTYGNIERAAKLIEKKGYPHPVALDIALTLFQSKAPSESVIPRIQRVISADDYRAEYGILHEYRHDVNGANAGDIVY